MTLNVAVHPQVLSQRALNERRDDHADASGHSLAGTLVNGPTWAQASTATVNFDGVDGFVNLGNPASR